MSLHADQGDPYRGVLPSLTANIPVSYEVPEEAEAKVNANAGDNTKRVVLPLQMPVRKIRLIGTPLHVMGKN